ncbi:MAG: hypothetical protein L3K03_00785 [Thermoplasmata archaeon]|nr:hypothetical protein [Thermoplasmata archaeon]
MGDTKVRPTGRREEPLRSKTSTNETPSGATRVRAVGSVRVPVTLTACPRATLHQYPDGRLVFCVGLWDVERVARRCVSPATLRGYARASGLTGLAREIDELVHAAVAGEADG